MMLTTGHQTGHPDLLQPCTCTCCNPDLLQPCTCTCYNPDLLQPTQRSPRQGHLCTPDGGREGGLP